MEYTKESLPKSKVKFQVTLSENKFKEYYESAFKALSSGVAVKGFRKGKAPRSLAEAEIGPDKIFSEALDRALPEIYHEIVHKEKITPISQPKVKIEEFDAKKPLKFSFEVDILPEIKLPNYKNIKVKKPKISVSEKEISEAFKNIQNSYAELKEVKRAAKKGDKVEIDFEGFLNHVKIESLISKNHPIILGQTKLIPGFEEKLLGLKAGDQKKFTIMMPKDGRDKLVAGKDVDFEIKVNRVEEINYPKIDEKFIKKISKFKTIKEFKDSVQKSMSAKCR